MEDCSSESETMGTEAVEEIADKGDADKIGVRSEVVSVAPYVRFLQYFSRKTKA